MLKILLISIIGIIVINMIKQYCPEYAIIATVGVSICLLWVVLGKLSFLMDEIGDMKGSLNIDSKLSSDAAKLILIAYARKFGCDICCDFGYKSISDKVDVFARIAAGVVLIPQMHSLYVDIIKLL